MTTIYLIRHAEAEGNIFRRLHGQYDSLLTPRGHLQVAVLAKRFENVAIDGCFASDLTRTCLTSRAVYVPKGLPLHRDRRFREVDVGSWEDLPYGYLDNFAAEKMRLFNHNPEAWQVPGSERYDEYTARFLEGMVDAAEQFPGGTIAIFGHGAVIRGTLIRLFYPGRPDDLNYSDNTGVSKLFYDRGRFTYEYLNDNSHIPEQLSTNFIQRWWRATDNRKESAVYDLPLNQAEVPENLPVPPMEEGGTAVAAMLCGKCVGIASFGAPEGSTGRILGMSLLPGFDGRYYGDQMLGFAFSHFRKLGCTTLWAAPGTYPDDVVARYEFDLRNRQLCIDPGQYRWEDAL